MIPTRSTIPAAILAATLGLLVNPASAEDEGARRVHLRFAGAFINALEYITPSGEPAAGPHAQLRAWGSPGRADITLFAARSGAPDFGSDCCGSGVPCAVVPIVENPLVITFADLSQLYANGSGEVCLDLLSGGSTGVVDATFTGGRGRFEGASGEAVIEFENEAVSSDGSLSAQSGRIKGVLR